MSSDEDMTHLSRFSNMSQNEPERTDEVARLDPRERFQHLIIELISHVTMHVRQLSQSFVVRHCALVRRGSLTAEVVRHSVDAIGVKARRDRNWSDSK